ncbi:ABC transporter substrate-binding protein [Devosia ginsengisoli]|uniref:ABC transporter substrate-binding protein n=1 Tax=Devosia ginsengisoli TaxID=400770 RepID=A0A5B8LY67_9HYPH|nr:ABC transporter substrate-binding protein [Devosia ginsengisoli]QDZ12751.1 ABC transporter substrate-binding protein [Devosia ginsengisoli]
MITISRRQLLVGTAASAILAATGLPVLAQQDVQRGGTIVRADVLAADSLDPHLASARSGSMSLVFDSLFSYRLKEGTTDQFELGFALATAYEETGEKAARLTIRPDVKFHDGSALTADVVKWNLERARDHEKSSVKVAVAELAGVTVVDDHTLDLEFETPQPLFTLTMTPGNATNVFIVSREAAEAAGDDAFGRKPVGSGPYMVENWLVDDRLELTAFAGHWESGLDGKALPYADKFVVRLMPDQSVAALELRAGNVHIIDPLDQDLDSLAAAGIQIYAVPGTETGQPSFYISSKADAETPFAHDVRLRQALQHAVDRESMAAALTFGRGQAHYYWGWYPGVPGYDESLPRYEYNPEKARQLLTEAGHADGVALTVKVINRPKDLQPLEIMQAMLGEVGITLNIETMDRTPWVESGRTGNFEALSHGNTALVDPLFRRETMTGSDANWAGYSNPEVDALWEEASRTGDESARAEIYKKIQVILHDDAYHFIAFRAPKMLALASGLSGVDSGYNLRYARLA